MNSLLRSSCFQTESSITANVKVESRAGAPRRPARARNVALANLSSSHGGEATH